MVRIRKNANTLDAAETRPLRRGVRQLNNQGAGRFADFRDMHTKRRSPQAHGDPGFCPGTAPTCSISSASCRRSIPSVALPYWRFDQPAPNIFTRDFLGVSNTLGTVSSARRNPLQFWTTDGVPGINRRPFFNTASAPPAAQRSADAGAGESRTATFRQMESNPHGLGAHELRRLDLQIADRRQRSAVLPAALQRRSAVGEMAAANSRFDPAVAASFDSNRERRSGHNLPDTMWPWNGVTGGSGRRPRPAARWRHRRASPRRGCQPRVRDCLDFQGVINARAYGIRLR